jgi:hypothetical protein
VTSFYKVNALALAFSDEARMAAKEVDRMRACDEEAGMGACPATEASARAI